MAATILKEVSGSFFSMDMWGKKEVTKVEKMGQAFVEVEIKVPKESLESVGLNFQNIEAIPEKLTARIPTFIPRNLPKLDSETLKKYEQLTMKLADWASDQLPDVLSDEELMGLSGDTVTYWANMFPEMDIDSDKFFDFLKEMNILQYFDAMFDNPAFKEERKKWMNIEGKWNPEFLNFLSVVEGAIVSGDFEVAGNAAFRMEIVHQSPVLATFIGAFWEAFKDAGDNFRTYTLSIYWRILRASQMFQQESKGFGEEIFRYCRYVESGTVHCEKFIWDLKHSSKISKEVLENPFYSGFTKTGEKLTCALNDILGLQKDLQTGDFKNMVIFKALNGADLKDAWESEIQLFIKNLEIYQGFKERLFQSAMSKKEEQDLEFLVDIWDSIVFSFVLQGKYSPKYATGDSIKLTGIDGLC